MSNRGFTLLELLISTFVLMVGVAAVAGLVSRFFIYDLYLTPKMQAAYLSQEGIEIVKNIRDTNWIEGQSWDQNIFCCGGVDCDCEADYDDEELSTYVGRNLHINEVSGIFLYGTGEKTDFTRKIEVKKVSQDKIEVCATTRWGAGGNKKIRACSDLYNWYGFQ